MDLIEFRENYEKATELNKDLKRTVLEDKDFLLIEALLEIKKRLMMK